MSATLYDKDFYKWALEQAHYIKTKAFDNLDIEHLFEEVESMGASEVRELESRLEVLLVHLLKWKYQPSLQSRSWQLTIKEQRKRILLRLKKMPSLKSKLPEIFFESYDLSIDVAEKETGLPATTFPNICDWTIEQVLSDEFYPN